MTTITYYFTPTNDPSEACSVYCQHWPQCLVSDGPY